MRRRRLIVLFSNTWRHGALTRELAFARIFSATPVTEGLGGRDRELQGRGTVLFRPCRGYRLRSYHDVLADLLRLLLRAVYLRRQAAPWAVR